MGSPAGNRAIRLAALASALLALLVAGVVTRDVLGFVGKPWSGLPMLPDGSLAPLNLLPERVRPDAGHLRFNARIVSVSGVPANDAADVRAALTAADPEQPIAYTFRTRGGEVIEARLPVTTFTLEDYTRAALPLTIGGLLGLALGLVPILAHPARTDTRLFFLFNLALAVNFGFLMPDAYYLHHYPRWGFPAAALAAGTLLHLGCIVPRPMALMRRFPRTCLALIYGWTALLAVLLGARARYAFGLMAATFLAGMCALAVTCLATVRADGDPRLTRQARMLLVGLALLVTSGVLFVAGQSGLVPGSVPVIVHLAPLWLLGVLVTYAMLRLNMFEFDAVVRRGLTLAILAAGALTGYAVAYAIAQLWLPENVAWAVAGFAAVLALTMIPAVASLRVGLEEAIERTLFPAQRAARAAVFAAIRELARPRGVRELGRAVGDAARLGVAASSFRLLTGRPDGELRDVACDEEQAVLVLPPGDPLHGVLLIPTATSFERGTLLPRRGVSRAAALRAEELGVHLAVPLPRSASGVGGLLLGARSDGRPYTRDDLGLLQVLAAQASVALESAAAWEEVRRLEQRLNAENLYLREEVLQAQGVTGIVGATPALRALLAQIEQVAPTDATVLVQGETGTGKELVVHALHEASRRRDRMLVKVACAALPEALLESELFGYERGAFTGASGRKPGRFEVADGGTLFLDDVDTLPLAVQAKLLRALQEGEVQRLGSNQVRAVDVRVVAATNRNLLAEVQAGRFREDLYYRLNVVPLRVPPLRERLDDLPALIEHFIAQDGPRLGRTDVQSVASEALAAMHAYPWPGNVRELRNVIQRALVLSRGTTLRLVEPLAVPNGAGAGELPLRGGSLADQVRELKVRLIERALSESGGNHRIAAERLGMHRQSLTRMIHDLGLQPPAANGATAGVKSRAADGARQRTAGSPASASGRRSP